MSQSQYKTGIPGRGSGEKSPGFSTLAVHGGEPRPKLGNSLATPIVQTATYTFADTQELHDHFQRRIEREEYGRYGNPTQRVAEQKLAALEAAEDCLLFSSGMAAITTTLYAVLGHGSHVVVTDDSYRRTRQFLTQILHRYGIEVSVVPAGDYQAMEEAIRPTTRVLVSESPTNPYNRIVDMERFAGIGAKHRVKTMIDATFATPFNQRPLEFGVDIVMHSATKYLGGHSDVMLGSVSAGKATWARLADTVHGLGLCVGPDDIYLGHRGLRTMGVRLAHHHQAGLKVAHWLAARPEVARVLHPAIESHPQHALWRRDFSGASGLFSFVFKPVAQTAVNAFLNELTLFGIGASWGGYESLAIPFDCTTMRTATRWAPGGPTVRLHIGLEDVDDLIGDLERGFAALAVAR